MVFFCKEIQLPTCFIVVGILFSFNILSINNNSRVILFNYAICRVFWPNDILKNFIRILNVRGRILRLRAIKD